MQRQKGKAKGQEKEEQKREIGKTKIRRKEKQTERQKTPREGGKITNRTRPYHAMKTRSYSDEERLETASTTMTVSTTERRRCLPPAAPQEQGRQRRMLERLGGTAKYWRRTS